jgi:hypothetical protein
VQGFVVAPLAPSEPRSLRYAQEMPMIIGFSRVLLRIFASECGNAVAEPVGDFLNSLIYRNKYAPLTNHLTLRRRSNVIVSSRS